MHDQRNANLVHTAATRRADAHQDRAADESAEGAEDHAQPGFLGSDCICVVVHDFYQEVIENDNGAGQATDKDRQQHDKRCLARLDRGEEFLDSDFSAEEFQWLNECEAGLRSEYRKNRTGEAGWPLPQFQSA